MIKCEKCGDRGYVLTSQGTISVCDCQKDIVYNKLYDFVGIDPQMVDIDVDEENYNIETLNGKNLTFQKSLQYVFWNWKEENNLNLYIQGPTGTGKTLWANNLLQKVVQRAEKENMKIKNTAYIIDNNILLQKWKDGWKDRDLKNEVNNILNSPIC